MIELCWLPRRFNVKYWTKKWMDRNDGKMWWKYDGFDPSSSNLRLTTDGKRFGTFATSRCCATWKFMKNEISISWKLNKVRFSIKRVYFLFPHIKYVAKDFRPQGLSGIFGVLVSAVDQVDNGARSWPLGRSFSSTSCSSTSCVLSSRYARESHRSLFDPVIGVPIANS